MLNQPTRESPAEQQSAQKPPQEPVSNQTDFHRMESFLGAYQESGEQIASSDSSKEPVNKVSQEDKQIDDEKPRPFSLTGLIEPFNELLTTEQIFVESMKQFADQLKVVIEALPKQKIRTKMPLREYTRWYQELGKNPFAELAVIDKSKATNEIVEEKVTKLAEIIQSEAMIDHIAYMAKIAKHYMDIIQFFANETVKKELAMATTNTHIDIQNLVANELIKPVQRVMRYHLTLTTAINRCGENNALKALLEGTDLKTQHFAGLADELMNDTSSKAPKNIEATIRQVHTRLKRGSAKYLKASVTLDTGESNNLIIDSRSSTSGHPSTSGYSAGSSSTVLTANQDQRSTVSTKEEELLRLMKQVVTKAVVEYQAWYQQHRFQLRWSFFHRHGSDGQQRAIKLMSEIEDTESLEAAKNVMYRHLNRAKGRLNPHSLDTYLIYVIANDITLRDYFLPLKSNTTEINKPVAEYNYGLRFFMNANGPMRIPNQPNVLTALPLASKQDIKNNLIKAKAELISYCAS